MADTVMLFCDLCSRSYTGTANRYPNSSGTEPPAATHGTYNGTSWVGMVLLPQSFEGQKITSIKLTLTGNAAGTTAQKTVYIWSSNHQTTSASGRGSIYPRSQLGTISGYFRNNTVTVELAGSTLDAVAEYLATGDRMLILYDPYGGSNNYCRFTSIYAEITYGSPQSTVKIMSGGIWHECVVRYFDHGVWYDCNVKIRSNNAWNDTSHS